MPDIRGSVESCVVVPDYSKLLELERQRQELVFSREICEEEEMALDFLATKAFKEPEEFDKALRKREFEIDQALTLQVGPAHTAFIALDSFATVKKLRKKLRYLPLTSNQYLEALESTIGIPAINLGRDFESYLEKDQRYNASSSRIFEGDEHAAKDYENMSLVSIIKEK